jgi:hypothetical protein
MAMLPPEREQAFVAERFRDRMARMAKPGILLGRRSRAGQGGRRRSDWRVWLAIDAIGLLLVVTMIVVWPPLGACRDQARVFGLHAGDTIGTCTRRGVAERLDRADQRIKMLYRGAGG